MSTERFPARAAGTLVCGHPTACMYRWLGTDKKIHKYCMACLFEKSGLKDLDSIGNEMKAEVEKLVKPAPAIKETPKPIKTSTIEGGVTSIGKVTTKLDTDKTVKAKTVIKEKEEKTA